MVSVYTDNTADPATITGTMNANTMLASKGGLYTIFCPVQGGLTKNYIYHFFQVSAWNTRKSPANFGTVIYDSVIS